MKDTLFAWLQQLPYLAFLAALMLATHIFSPTEGIGALYGDLLTGLITIPVVIERWLTRSYRRERLSDLASIALLAGAVILFIVPAALDLARGSKTVTTQNYRAREVDWITHRKTRYILELPETRARLYIDYPNYSLLTNTHTHTIRVEYWPASDTLRRLTINPTEETR